MSACTCYGFAFPSCPDVLEFDQGVYKDMACPSSKDGSSHRSSTLPIASIQTVTSSPDHRTPSPRVARCLSPIICSRRRCPVARRSGFRKPVHEVSWSILVSAFEARWLMNVSRFRPGPSSMASRARRQRRQDRTQSPAPQASREERGYDSDSSDSLADYFACARELERGSGGVQVQRCKLVRP